MSSFLSLPTIVASSPSQVGLFASALGITSAIEEMTAKERKPISAIAKTNGFSRNGYSEVRLGLFPFPKPSFILF
jgi:hypothetical protein